MFILEARERAKNEDINFLRKKGEIPAVSYGSGSKNLIIAVPAVQFKKIWKEAGESSAIKLSIGKDKIDVLIYDVQNDPLSEEPIHIDFLVIDMTKKIKVKVPLEFTGISPAVKNGLGNLVKVMHEVEVEALPADLPHMLSVDLSRLENLDSNILVSDIEVSSEVKVVSNLSDVVASIVAQVEEKEEASAPVDLSAIEVEKKGKKEEAEGENAEASATDKK